MNINHCAPLSTNEGALATKRQAEGGHGEEKELQGIDTRGLLLLDQQTLCKKR